MREAPVRTEPYPTSAALPLDWLCPYDVILNDSAFQTGKAACCRRAIIRPILDGVTPQGREMREAPGSDGTSPNLMRDL
jgi:hypothetical protein